MVRSWPLPDGEEATTDVGSAAQSPPGPRRWHGTETSFFSTELVQTVQGTPRR